MSKREVDIVIISDVHLGAVDCKAQALLDYLISIQVQTLVLNGDFLDFVQYRKYGLNDIQKKVVATIAQMAKNGTKVYNIADQQSSQTLTRIGLPAKYLHPREKLILQLKGKAIWIFHGKLYDVSSSFSRRLANYGKLGVRMLALKNRLRYLLESILGISSISKGDLKKQIKEHIAAFENLVTKMAGQRGYDYVICGHTHLPDMKSFKFENRKVTYLNSGDWLSSMTALEYKWGRWSIYEYDDYDYQSALNP